MKLKLKIDMNKLKIKSVRSTLFMAVLGEMRKQTKKRDKEHNVRTDIEFLGEYGLIMTISGKEENVKNAFEGKDVSKKKGLKNQIKNLKAKMSKFKIGGLPGRQVKKGLDNFGLKIEYWYEKDEDEI